MMQLQVLLDHPANRTNFGRGVESIYPFGHSTRPCTFIVQEDSESTPPAIANRLGKMMIFEHPADIQVFNLDISVLVDDLSTEFVQKIIALVGNFLMLPGYRKPRLLPALASFLTTAKATLQPFKALLGFPEILRMINLYLSVYGSGQNGKMLKAQVNTYHAQWWCGVLDFNLTLNRDVVFAAGGFADSTVFHLAVNRAVENSPYPTNFGQIDTAAVNLEPLWVTDGLMVMFTFEFWVFCPALEEVFVGPVKVFEFLLKYLTIGFFQPGHESFDHREHIGRVVIDQTFAMLIVVGLTCSKTPIIDETSVPELDSQGRLLLFIGIDSILKRLFGFQCIS